MGRMGGAARAKVGVSLVAMASLCALEACSTGPESDGEDLARGAVQQGLSGASQLSPGALTPSSSSTSTVTIHWNVATPLVELGLGGTLNLEIQNNEDAPVDAEIVLEIDGLGAHRTRSLGTVHLAARERGALLWSPSTSPIAPWGTLARVTAEARYRREGLGQRIPAPLLFLAFSRNGSRAFASVEDGEFVRLASLGRRSSPWSKGTVTAEDRDAELAQMGGRRGTLDGVPLDQSLAEALTRRAQLSAQRSERAADGSTARILALDEDDPGDSISRDGDASLAPQSIVIRPVNPGPLPYCPGVIYPVTDPTCISLRPTGFRDLDIVAPVNVPPEDVNLLSYPAAYANAAIYESGVLRWSGRLDGNGCTPAVWYCAQNARIEVSTSSFQRWTQFNNLNISRSREIRLTPARIFVAQVILASSLITGRPIGAANVRPSTVADERLLRVAAVLARTLRMPDNGLGDGTSPPLNVHTENGCCSFPEFRYTTWTGQTLCGEACANANDAWFGQGLAIQPNGTYRPTSVHTTQDAYVIGHELGHSVQQAAAGGPPSGGYNDTGVGNCSCDHVRDGNRLHCLQSSHNVASAEAEGFAHFYAARVMNEKAATARFTYYKDVRRFAAYYANGSPLVGAYPVAPPVPVNAGQPAYDPSWYGQTNGWVRKFCPAANRSSEYDWLTFLWAINGKVSSANLSMPEVFAVLGGVSGGFTWPKIRVRAESYFGASSPKFIRFTGQANENGTNL